MRSVCKGLHKPRRRKRFQTLESNNYKQTTIDNYFQVRSSLNSSKAKMSQRQSPSTALKALESQTSIVCYGTTNVYINQKGNDELMANSREDFENRDKVFSAASFTSDNSNLPCSTPVKSVANIGTDRLPDSDGDSDETISCSPPSQYIVNTPRNKPKILLHSSLIFPPTVVNQNKQHDQNGSPRKRKLEEPTTSELNCPGGEKQLKPEHGKKLNMKSVDLMCTLITKVIKQFRHVFLDTELKELEKFCKLSDKHKYFLFKLFMYLPKWYNIYAFSRQINLALEEVEVHELYKFVKKNKYIITGYEQECVQDLLNLLPKRELEDLCNTFKLPSSCRKTKDIMKGALLGMSATQMTITPTKSLSDVLQKKIISKLGTCVKLDPVFRRLLTNAYLLYTFTNHKFIKREVFFYDMVDAKITFPEYTVEPFIKVFDSRLDFHSFTEAHEMRARLEELIISKQKKTDCHAQVFDIAQKAFDALKKLIEGNGGVNSETSSENRYPHLVYYTAKSQYVSILNKSSDYLRTRYSTFVKECLYYLLKLEQYKHYFGKWYCQLALILERHCAKNNQAADLLIKALHRKNDFSDIDLEEIAIRARRLNNSRQHRISTGNHDTLVRLLPNPPDSEAFPTCTVTAKSVRSNSQGRKRHYLVNCENGDREFSSVEEVALVHYKSNGYPDGMHCEGSIICSIFSLLFWDIIYGKYVQGAFISELQSCPLDFKTPYFYSNRRAEIDERLQEIVNWSDEEFEEFFTNKFNNHSHESSIYTIPANLSVPVLLKVISCIGRTVLGEIFRRLVKNFRHYRSGMPDLLVWNYDDKKCKFVEVKGEGDKLSIKQKFWLHHLRSINADVEVCQVQSVSYQRH